MTRPLPSSPTITGDTPYNDVSLEVAQWVHAPPGADAPLDRFGIDATLQAVIETSHLNTMARASGTETATGLGLMYLTLLWNGANDRTRMTDADVDQIRRTLTVRAAVAWMLVLSSDSYYSHDKPLSVGQYLLHYGDPEVGWAYCAAGISPAEAAAHRDPGAAWTLAVLHGHVLPPVPAPAASSGVVAAG